MVKRPCEDSFRPMVLLADDNPDFLEPLIYFLAKADKVDYVTASTGREIIELVNAQCFDAFILDIKYPDILGPAVAEAIQEVDPEASIVFLSNYDVESVQADIKRLNVGFWNKTLVNVAEISEDIYQLAIKCPCSDPNRILSRGYAKLKKERSGKGRKATIPNVLLEASEGI